MICCAVLNIAYLLHHLFAEYSTQKRNSLYRKIIYTFVETAINFDWLTWSNSGKN